MRGCVSSLVLDYSLMLALPSFQENISNWLKIPHKACAAASIPLCNLVLPSAAQVNAPFRESYFRFLSLLLHGFKTVFPKFLMCIYLTFLIVFLKFSQLYFCNISKKAWGKPDCLLNWDSCSKNPIPWLHLYFPIYPNILGPYLSIIFC